MEASITDAVTLERLAGYYADVAENHAQYSSQCGKGVAKFLCEGGCGRHTRGKDGPCPDCLRLVAAACRDAAGRVEK